MFLFFKIGWIIITISFILGFCLAYDIIIVPFLQIEIVLIPIGCGFLLLVPWSYLEADKIRKECGRINFRYLSYCGKNIFFGIIFIVVFFIIHYYKTE
jgi:hypothetical protein